MLQNHLKIAWRNLVKQKMYSTIKIGGFALGIAACFLISLFIRDELSYDLHYPEGQNIYRLVLVDKSDGELSKHVFLHAPFAKALKEDYPEIVLSGRYLASELFGAGSKQFRRSDQVENTYEEGVIFADQELLDILQIPMVYGDSDRALAEPHTIVISKSKAEKYFKNEDPVGQTLILNDNKDIPYTIGGVMADFPANSHLQFDFLITLSGREFWDGEQSSWIAQNYPTYVKLQPGTHVAQLEEKLTSIVQKYMVPGLKQAGFADAGKDAEYISFELQRVSDIHLQAEVSDGLSHGDIRFVWLFGAIAGFILLIACINFINLSTAKSANRAVEVGLRKTVGSGRDTLIGQFLMESMLFSFLSVTLGVLLASLALPFFNELANKSIEIPFSAWWFFPILIIGTLAVGLLAGLYPSFYLSKFKPIEVLQGSLSKGSKSSGLRGALVVFQFTTSIILIIGTFIIYQQMGFVLNKKLGFDKEQVLLLQGTQTLEARIRPLKEKLLQLPEVKNVSVSGYLPIRGTRRNQNGFYTEGKAGETKTYAQYWRVDHDYIETMGMELVEGRNFFPDRPSDSSAVIINETMARSLNIKYPFEQKVSNGDEFHVIGIVKDFHYESLKDDIGSLCMSLGNSPSIVSVKVHTSDMSGLLQSIIKVWDDFSPNQAIRYSFLDEKYARMYDDVQRAGKIFSSFALLAIIVACLGLFALSAFMTEQRSKEISVRLVLGASMKSIFRLLTLDFLKLILISIIIATPIAWYMMQRWLEDFAYRIAISWEVFLLAGLMAVCIALLTISFHSVHAAMLNPARSLRS